MIFVQRDTAIVIVGDGVASVLDQPDESTAGMCLMSRTDTTWLKEDKELHATQWRLWKFHRCHWWKALGKGRRFALMYIHFLGWCTAIVACGFTLQRLSTPG